MSPTPAEFAAAINDHLPAQLDCAVGDFSFAYNTQAPAVCGSGAGRRAVLEFEIAGGCLQRVYPAARGSVDALILGQWTAVVADLLGRASPDESAAALTFEFDGHRTDLLGIKNRATQRYIGTENASGSLQLDLVDSPFGAVSATVVAAGGRTKVVFDRPGVPDGVIQVEYLRILPVTTGHGPLGAFLDDLDGIQAHFAVVSMFTGLLYGKPEGSLDGKRLLSALGSLATLRRSPAFLSLMDHVDDAL